MPEASKPGDGRRSLLAEPLPPHGAGIAVKACFRPAPWGVLVSRPAALTHDQAGGVHPAVGRVRPGPLRRAVVADRPHILEVRRDAQLETTAVFGGFWHSDWSFQETPPAATILHAKVIRCRWATIPTTPTASRAWEALSPAFQAMLAPLRAVHSAARPYGSAELLRQGGGPHGHEDPPWCRGGGTFVHLPQRGASGHPRRRDPVHQPDLYGRDRRLKRGGRRGYSASSSST